MDNMTRYAARSGTQPFDVLAPTVVDGVILAQLAYFPFETLGGGLNRLDALQDPALRQALVQDTWRPAANAALLAVLAAQPRYRTIRWHSAVSQLDVQAEQQFSAITFSLPTGVHVLAFRGTRAAFVDWKEDFNLAYLQTIPSQRAALAYFIDIAARFPGRYALAGHSKGGNLATYAYAHAPAALQAQVAAVVNADGPGLGTPVPPALQARVHKLVPQSSVIGTLFDPEQVYQVVESTAHALNQHDPFTWRVAERDFVYRPATDALAQYTQRSIAAWVAGLDDETKRAALDAAYALVTQGHATTFADLRTDWPQSARAILTGLRHQDPAVTAQWRRVLSQLLAALWQSLPQPKRPDWPTLPAQLTDWSPPSWPPDWHLPRPFTKSPPPQ
ncbi:Mbeg1-like protein [Lacticaseibacillus absianus]|uniref:Mbeg1-like protein n=1 Tax=Lacticaseibacillus absianus TaxID=2729623 RepID=UPI0015C9F6EB|nr:Mbeg1-like protein [Lacticaseibacillus absianus]